MRPPDFATGYEYEWFSMMINNGWEYKEVWCILSGEFYIWTHKETKKKLDERVWIRDGMEISWSFSNMIAPSKDKFKYFISEKDSDWLNFGGLFRPFEGGIPNV